VLGVWWKRANRQGAIAGMLVGLARAGGTCWRCATPRPGTASRAVARPDDLRFGIVGMAASLIAMVVVTLLFPAPDEETQRMVDEVRIPRGETILAPMK
jgi:cation/acetate symporter